MGCYECKFGKSSQLEGNLLVDEGTQNMIGHVDSNKKRHHGRVTPQNRQMGFSKE